MTTEEAARMSGVAVTDHAKPSEKIKDRRAGRTWRESKRVMALFPTAVAVIALYLMTLEAVRHNETAAELKEARAELARVKAEQQASAEGWTCSTDKRWGEYCHRRARGDS